MFRPNRSCKRNYHSGFRGNRERERGDGREERGRMKEVRKGTIKEFKREVSVTTHVITSPLFVAGDFLSGLNVKHSQT